MCNLEGTRPPGQFELALEVNKNERADGHSACELEDAIRLASMKSGGHARRVATRNSVSGSSGWGRCRGRR